MRTKDHSEASILTIHKIVIHVLNMIQPLGNIEIRFFSIIFLLHQNYILDLLVETGNSTYDPVDTSIEINHYLSIYPDQIPTNKEKYQRLVGKLIYLTYTI